MARGRPPDSAPLPADPYADHDAIRAEVKRTIEEWSHGRETFLRAAKRNLMFYRGHQWIRYDRLLNRFRTVTLRKGTPQPVTNRFASTMDAITSVFARIEPKLNSRPATDDPDDRAAADVAVRAIQVIEDEVNVRMNRQHLAAWVGLTGGAWIETGYDPDPIHGMRTLQHEECLECGTVQPPTQAATCVACGSKLLIPAVGPDGAPVGERVPIGRMYLDVVSPFEMFFDPAVTDWKKQRAYARRKSLTLDDAKRRWPDLADAIQPDSLMSDSQLSGGDLPTLGPSLDDGTPMRGLQTTQSRQQNNRVTEEWFHRLPDATYPEGLLHIQLGQSLTAYAGPLPYTRLGEQGERIPFLNTVFFPQKLVPGTAWPKTVADDLAAKQIIRNQIESLLILILMRTGNPIWLVPNGADVRNLSGEVGQIAGYNALGPSAAKPERIPGQGFPAGSMTMIQSIDNDFEELSAAFDVIKGQRPEGVNAGVALQILQERGLNRFGSLLIMWETAWAEWSSQALEIFRQFVTEPRLLRIQGRDGAWQVQKFLGADLQGRVDIIAEAGSSMPRSTLLDRAEIEQLTMQGYLSPRDPEVREKVLEAYGRSNMLPSMALETKNALMENEAFEALGPQVRAFTPEQQAAIAQVVATAPDQLAPALQQLGLEIPTVSPAVDDHGIHLREILMLLRSETGKALPKLVRMLAEAHAADHRKYLAAENLPQPPVKVTLTGPLDPQTAHDLSGDQTPMGPPAQGSGLLTPPPAQHSHVYAQPMNAGSSGRRMMGDLHEMQHQMAPGGV